MEYNITINGLGNFYLEKELVDENLLFICKNNNTKYLVTAYNYDIDNYILCKITNETLLDMLTQKITMEQAFRKSDKIYETYIEDNSDTIYYKEYKSSKFNGSKLPNVGAYYKVASQYILDYINFIKTEIENSK